MRINRSRFRGLLLAPLALYTACAPPEPEELGVSWELAEHRVSTISNVEYAIELRVPEDRDDPLIGETTITFDWSDPAGLPVTVDFKDPGERVSVVEVNGVDVVWSPENDHVVIAAEHFTPDASNSVLLRYEAGDEALNRNDEFLYTLFVPDRAHFSIPVFDQPNLKARVAWRFLLPPDWVAVANGPTLGGWSVPVELAGNGLSEDELRAEGDRPPQDVAFSASEPIPTYLFAFAAGRFQVERGERDGRTFTMYHRETDEESVARNASEIFDLHASALEWLEEYTGIDYPFQKFDFVLIPPFQYGGMEHPGAVTYRQSSLMLDESATQGQRLGRASLIAHETAHMWFGDLVTMNWFDDVWTKEVFANFMAAKIVQPSFPEVDHELRFVTAHHPSAYGVDRTMGANPIRQPLENLREAGTLYGSIIYQKAPVVMKQLELTVGEETFRDGLRRYLADHAYGNATWPALIEILDDLHPSDLASWSQVWVEEPGRPTIHIEHDEGGEGVGRVTLRQDDVWGRNRLWPQEMVLAAVNGDQVVETAVSFDAREVVLEAWTGVERPDFIIPNASGVEYGLFLPDAASRTATVQALPTLESDLLRGAGWINVREWLREGVVAPSEVLDVALANVGDEENQLILSQMLGAISQIYWGLLPDADRRARSAEVEDVLWSGVEGAENVSIRSSFFSSFRGIASTPPALRRLERAWSGEEPVSGLPLSESDRIALASTLAVKGADGAEAILDRMQEEIQNPDRLARFEWLRPSLSQDPSVREAFFETLAQEENREREPWVLSALGNLNHPLRREHARQFVGPSLALVEEIQATGDIFFPQRWLGAALGSHSDPEVAAEIINFLEARPDYPHRLRGKILQSYDGVRRAARALHGPDAAPEWTPWPDGEMN